MPSATPNPETHVQLSISSLPVGESELEGQDRQNISLVDPTHDEYLPASHGVHTPGPVSALYVPASHAVQGPPSSPDDPELQTQASLIALPEGESEFAEHALHIAEDGAAIVRE